jgi:hypothetical protein
MSLANFFKKPFFISLLWVVDNFLHVSCTYPIFGEPRVNVLELNLALDGLRPKPKP